MPGRSAALPGRCMALPGRSMALPGRDIALPGRCTLLPELEGVVVKQGFDAAPILADMPCGVLQVETTATHVTVSPPATFFRQSSPTHRATLRSPEPARARTTVVDAVFATGHDSRLARLTSMLASGIETVVRGH